MDRLIDSDYLFGRILSPAVRHARQRELLTDTEERVLLTVAKLGIAKAGDLTDAMPGLNTKQRTYQVGKLVAARMLVPLREGARQYTVGFANNALIRGVIGSLTEEGFVPESLRRSR